VFFESRKLGAKNAFVWTEASGMQTLGALGSSEFDSTGSAVSGDGRIVMGKTGTGDERRVFVWDADHGMRDLQLLRRPGMVWPMTWMAGC